jgi:hypothetical protein
MARPSLTLPALILCFASSVANASEPPLEAGFGEADITPALGGKPVYLAGFGQNRKATEILDPLFVRAVVLRHGETKIAIASADVVGLFFTTVQRIRKELPGYTYVLVSSTHVHHGPDTIGMWGPNPFTSGVDSDYLKRVESAIVAVIRVAEKNLQPVAARIGRVAAPELLHDGRQPIVLHDELVALQFREPGTDKPAGIVVQWNCHPETLASSNTRLSSDYVGVTVRVLREKYGCPLVYLTGTVGGLMTTIRVDVPDEKGQRLPEGSVEKMQRYGQLLGRRAEEALAKAKPLALTPMQIRTREMALPVANKMFLVGKQLKVLDRPMEVWTGDPYQKPTSPATDPAEKAAVRTELGWLRLGDLDVAVIPGEIYPELVLGKVQDPPDPGADFPDAPIEPAIYAQLDRPHRMLIGLGNDELGYILPKRQWDEKPPFTYGQTKAPYGEVNSLGPDTAPLLCRAFRELVKGKKD